MKWILKIAAIASLSLPALLSAGSLSEATFIGQIQQSMELGKVSSCGVAISAMEIAQPPTGTLNIFNGSLYLVNLSSGLVKGRAAKADAALLVSGKFSEKDIKPVPTKYIWAKGYRSKATAARSLREVMRLDDPTYIIYNSDFDSIMGVFDSILQRKPIQVGMLAQGAPNDTVLFGVVEISDAEREQFRECLSDLFAVYKGKLK